MKRLNTCVLAFALLAAPGIALAQSSPSPANTCGAALSATAPGPTEMGMASETGNLWGFPCRLGTRGQAVYEQSLAMGSYAMSGSQPRPNSMRAPSK